MASTAVLRARVRLMQEGFEQKLVQPIPGFIHPTFRTYSFVSVESSGAQNGKKSFQCVADEDSDEYCSVAKGKVVQCVNEDAAPSDGNETDSKDDSYGSSKEAQSSQSSQSNAGCSSSLVCGSSRGNGQDDDGDDDKERGNNKKRKEPEDAPTWWSTDEQDLLLRQRDALKTRTDAAAKSLVQLIQRLLRDPQLVGPPERRRVLRGVVMWAVRIVFGQPWLGQHMSTAASCKRSDTVELNRSRPPELPARLRSVADAQDRRCVAVDLRLNAQTGGTGPHRGTPSFHCLLGRSSGSDDSDDTPGPQVPSPPSGETTMTYGEIQDLQAPVQCTDNNLENEAATAERPRNGGESDMFQPLPPVTSTFQLSLRDQIQVCVHPCEDLNEGEEDTIDMRRSLLVPDDANGPRNNEEFVSAESNAAASAPWLTQMDQHLNCAAHDVQSGGCGFRRPMQASELCDKCIQREMCEILNPCRHKMCNVCKNDMYPPASLQAIARPVRRCPVCRREVKHIEDQNLYPP